MRVITGAALLAIVIFSSGCANYLVIPEEPRPTGQEIPRTMISAVGGIVTSPYPGVVADCGADQLARVRVTRNLGQGLLSALTLGLFAPVTVHYLCATPPQPSGGTIDTSGGSGD